MPVLGNIIMATLAVSLISLTGICLIHLKETTLEGVLDCLVSFAVGGLLGGVFLHLFPEALESRNTALFSQFIRE